ncbi:MAG: SLBB domain-containing protein [Lentisphaerae bacterium]|nr:SLBB domain-containing protein [Lentisphaerota bacterium]
MKQSRVTRRGAVLLALAMILVGGCTTHPGADQRLARYTPDDAGRRPWEWSRTTSAVAPDAAAETNASLQLVLAAESVNGEPLSTGGAMLRRGDALVVSLKGIPRPEEFREEVDGTGSITLPLVGRIQIAGMLTSEAEDAIEQAYIDGKFYTKINVILVAEAGFYYVRGEVQRSGRYPVSGDITLIQAISTAGGYTDFAKPSRIKVIRNGEDMTFNADRIEDDKDTDPGIVANDTIIVPKRWM